MSNKLEKLEEHVAKRVASEEIEFHKALVREVFGKANPAFLEGLDFESLAAILAGAVKFMDNKLPDEIKVRATNPRYDADGWESNRTALEVSLSDRPFIVDSVIHELKRQGLDLQHYIHPILNVSRDAKGRLARELVPDRGHPEVYELYLTRWPTLIPTIRWPIRFESVKTFSTGSRVITSSSWVIASMISWTLPRDRP